MLLQRCDDYTDILGSRRAHLVVTKPKVRPTHPQLLTPTNQPTQLAQLQSTKIQNAKLRRSIAHEVWDTHSSNLKRRYKVRPQSIYLLKLSLLLARKYHFQTQTWPVLISGGQPSLKFCSSNAVLFMIPIFHMSARVHLCRLSYGNGQPELWKAKQINAI